MNSCKKCMRLLGYDESSCSYCGYSESNEVAKTDYVSPFSDGNISSFEEELIELDAIIEKDNTKINGNKELEVTKASETAQEYKESAVYSFSQTHDKNFDKMIPRVPEECSPMHFNLKVILIVTLIAVSAITGIGVFGGIIMGAYLLSRENKHYRTFGRWYIGISFFLLIMGITFLFLIS